MNEKDCSSDGFSHTFIKYFIRQETCLQDKRVVFEVVLSKSG